MIRMRIGFIGAGKVGFSLGRHFTGHGVCVSGYYSRNLNSSKEAAAFTKTKYYEQLDEIIKESDILFLTVPDGSIREVYSNMIPLDIEGKCLVHCSGALTSMVFSGINEKGARGCSIHPICAVSDKLTGYQDLSQAYFTIEGNDVEDLTAILQSCGNPVEVIEKSQKVQYHAASVFSSNLVIGLYDMAVGLLQECGLSESFAKHALQSLFIGNAQNVVSKGAVEALTGPVERADADTIEKHLASLEGEEREIYRLLSRRLIRLAEQKNQDRDYHSLWRILK
ncbi:MAG: Rossmann-like and DUF2520 domain-containing protein [Lachnospiraceae bacterium]